MALAGNGEEYDERRMPGRTATAVGNTPISGRIGRKLAADGSQRRREIVRHPGAVAILPVVDANHVCLIRNLPSLGRQDAG